MTFHHKNRGTAAQQIRPHYFLSKHRQQRAPNLPFRNQRNAAPDFDSACWFEAYGGAAIELNALAHQCGDER